MICPDCGTILAAQCGCFFCPACGYSLCRAGRKGGKAVRRLRKR